MRSSRKRRHADEASFDDLPRRRPRKWKRRLIALTLLLVAVIAAAPTIVANTPLRNLLNNALSADGWQIRSERGSLSWIGQQTLQGVSIVDPEGNPLLSAESVTLDRSLLALAANQKDLGRFTLVRPVANIVTDAEGSNLEDFLVSLKSSSTSNENQSNSSSNSKPKSSIGIVEGIVRGFDMPTGNKWLLDQANLVVELGDTSTGGFAITGEMNLSSDANSSPGRVKVQLQQIAENQKQLDLLAENLTLTPLEPLVSRMLPGCKMSGTASSTIQVRWTQTSAENYVVQTSGRIDVSQLEATADLLSGDRLLCQQLSIPWEVGIENGLATIGKFSIDSDWAQLAIAGTAKLDEFSRISLSNLPKQALDLKGRVQLDQLATMLPRTLQLRDGVRIDSGNLEFNANCEPKSSSNTWIASATIRDVVGTDGQRAIRWEQPIEAHIEAIDAAQGPQVKQLTVSAPFVQTALQTSANEIHGNFQLDLEKFSLEMGQFVDLKAWQFQGTGEGHLTLSRAENNHFEASANVKLNDLVVNHENQPIWIEPELQVNVETSGLSDKFTPKRLAAATAKLTGHRDSFNLTLLEPVDLSSAEHHWQLQLQGNGPLASWAGRLRPWMDSVPEQLEGDAQLIAKVDISAQEVHVVESEGSIAGLRIHDHAMAVDEPRVQFSGDCRWDAGSRSMNSSEIQLVSSSLAFRSRNFAVEGLSGEKNSKSIPTATGEVAFRANLERVALAYGLVGQPDSTWPRGMASGTLKLSSNADQLQADFSANADQLQLVRTPEVGSPQRANVVWAEPQLQSTGKAIYLIAADQLQLQDLQLTGQTVRLAGKAKLEKASSDQMLEAGGTLQYKEETLDQLLASYLGPEVRFQGDQQVRFHLTGQLADSQNSNSPAHWSRRWNISTDAGWSTASLFGLPLSEGRLQANVRDGQLQIVPLDIGVGQGRLTASPIVVFDPSPQQFLLPQGPLVSNVQISPQVSETMLKYVAPIVAGATRTHGTFRSPYKKPVFRWRTPNRLACLVDLMCTKCESPQDRWFPS